MKPNAQTFSDENLDFLRMLEGKFKGEVIFQDTQLSAYEEADLNESVMEHTFIYDSHFLKHDFHGKERNSEKTLLGTGYIGFNEKKATFEGFWIDNQNQAMNFDTGEKKGNSLLMHWEAEDASLQKIERSTETTVVDKDHHRVDFFQKDQKNGRIKTLSMEFVRQ